VTEKMTAAQARQFDTHSQENAMVLEMAAQLHGCHCKPYVDWFTYNRWQAQGMQVQKGEKSTKITTWVTVETEDKRTGEKKEKAYPHRTSVFCRCQVKAKGE